MRARPVVGTDCGINVGNRRNSAVVTPQNCSNIDFVDAP